MFLARLHETTDRTNYRRLHQIRELCFSLLAANSGVCARRCWSWLRLKHSGRAAAWDRKGKCTSCASTASRLFRGQDPLLLTMEVCRTRLARHIRDAASQEIVRPGPKPPSRRYA